jgi:hypothetical protein
LRNSRRIGRVSEHVPEKWKAVFRKDHAPPKAPATLTPPSHAHIGVEQRRGDETLATARRRLPDKLNRARARIIGIQKY